MDTPGKGSVVCLLCGVLGALVLLVVPCSAQTYLYNRATFATCWQPVAAVAMDFNGDGNFDLAVVNQKDNTVSILLGRSDATFETKVDYPVGNSPAFIVEADFNGDGFADLAVLNSGGNTVSILLGNGDGTFQGQVTYSTGIQPVGLVTADFNSDGKADLAVANSANSTVQILIGNGDGTFSSESPIIVGSIPAALAQGDFNGDGKTDLIMSGSGSMQPTVVVLLSKGDGSFTQVTTDVGVSAGAIAVGDFDNDGKLDAVLGTSVNSMQFLKGLGNGSFSPLGSGVMSTDYTISTKSLLAVDINGDGKLDVVASDSDDFAVLLGNGKGVFTPVPYQGGGFGPALLSADINGDGLPDVVFGGGLSLVLVALGSRDGTLGIGTSYSLSSVLPAANTIASWPAIAGDFNGDGKTDVALFEHLNAPGVIAVALSKGDGTFEPPVSTALTDEMAAAPAIGDFNGDGKLDLMAWTSNPYVINDTSEYLSLILGNGDGTFQETIHVPLSVSPQTSTIAVADFDGDGKLDLAIVTSPTVSQDNVQILLGQGNGTFKTGVSIPFLPLGNGVNFAGAGYLAAADFNHDGKADLAFANGETVAVLLGNGDGTFQNAVFYTGAPSIIQSIAAGDFNGDGNVDLVVSTYVGPSVLLGNGDGTFRSYLTSNFGFGMGPVIVGDFSGDGKLDLANTNIAAIGNGDGTFKYFQYFGVPATAVAAGDFNSDGVPDLAFDIQMNAAAPFFIWGLSAPQAVFSPASLGFPHVDAGSTSAPQDVAVTNAGTAPMTISSIVASGDFSETNTCGTTVAAGAGCTISVTFAPTGGGVRSGVITLNDNLKSSPQVIALSGVGIAATIDISPTSLTFSGQTMGATSDAQTVTLTNTGNIPLIVDSIAASGDFAQTNNCGAGVAVGSSCMISVTFTPSADGTRNGQLTITDNATGSPQSVSLAGSGPDFALAVASGSSSSATMNAGQTATYTLVLSAAQGFTGTVSFACSGAPTLSACTVSPQSSVLSDATPVNVTVKVTTTAGSSALPNTHSRPPAPWAKPRLVMGALLAWLLVLIFAPRPVARLRQVGFAGAVFTLVMLAPLAMPGCGGGGSGGGGGGGASGTPAGTYTLTVTATSASLTHSLGIKLTVN